MRLPFPHLLDSTSEIMSEHCDQVDEARWMMGCRIALLNTFLRQALFHHNLDSLLFNCKSKPQVRVVIDTH